MSDRVVEFLLLPPFEERGKKPDARQSEEPCVLSLFFYISLKSLFLYKAQQYATSKIKYLAIRVVKPLFVRTQGRRSAGHKKDACSIFFG
jgi:hypothetical protein